MGGASERDDSVKNADPAASGDDGEDEIDLHNLPYFKTFDESEDVALQYRSKLVSPWSDAESSDDERALTKEQQMRLERVKAIKLQTTTGREKQAQMIVRDAATFPVEFMDNPEDEIVDDAPEVLEKMKRRILLIRKSKDDLSKAIERKKTLKLNLEAVRSGTHKDEKIFSPKYNLSDVKSQLTERTGIRFRDTPRSRAMDAKAETHRKGLAQSVMQDTKLRQGAMLRSFEKRKAQKETQVVTLKERQAQQRQEIMEAMRDMKRKEADAIREQTKVNSERLKNFITTEKERVRQVHEIVKKNEQETIKRHSELKHKKRGQYRQKKAMKEQRLVEQTEIIRHLRDIQDEELEDIRDVKEVADHYTNEIVHLLLQPNGNSLTL